MEGDDEENTTSVMDEKHKLESDKYLIVKKNDASINNNRQDKKSTCNCCSRRNKLKPKSEEQEKKENKFSLVVKLVGSVLEESDEGYSIESDHNLRNFLFKLINLLKKEDCCLVLPRGNNNTLYKLVERISQTLTKEYEKVLFSTEEDFLKLISDFRHFECLLVYNGDHMDEKEQEEYIKNNRNIIILKESENLTRFEKALNDNDVHKGKVHSKKYVTMYINQTLTETSIAQKILHSYLGKDNVEDFLLLCIRLNQLDLAVQHGGLWKFNSLKSQAKDENKHIRKQIVLFSKSLERFDFIKYLIQHGVKITKYLEIDDILDNTEKDKTHLKVKYLIEPKDTDDQSSNTGNDSKERKLYIYAVITENFKLAVLLWRTLSRPTIAALYAIEIINDLKALYKKDLNDHVSKLDQEIRNFEDLAIFTLNKTYATNPDIVYDLLIYKLKGSWKDYNCVDLALRNNLGKFLSQTPCIMLNEEMWNNSSVPTNNIFEQAKMEQSETSNENCCMLCNLRAPKKIAITRFISHLLFLGFFAIWMISFLAVDTLHWTEWVLLIWVIFYSAEIVHQCRNNFMKHRRSCWSFIDRIELFSVLLFLISWSLHIAAYKHQDNQQLMDCVLTLFSIDFMLFCIFTLKFCYIKQSLGPRLIVLKKMAEILSHFLLIIFAFFIAFAVSSQAVLYPNTQLTGPLFFRIFKRPFWSMFGDFTLDDLESSECTSNASMYIDNEQLRCPSELGRFYVPIIMGIYVIIVNILLLNLVIALFNSAIKANEQQTEELWHCQFMSFTCEHSIIKFMMPPITWLSCLLPEDENNRRYPFDFEAKYLDKMKKIASIEQQQRDMYLTEVEDKKWNTVTYNYNTYNIFPSQKEMLKLVQNEVTENKKKILKEVQKTVSLALADVSKEILKVIQEDLKLMKEKLLQEGQETVSIAIQEVSKEILNIFQKDVIKMMKEKLLQDGQETASIAIQEVSKEILNIFQKDVIKMMKEKLLQDGQETFSIAIQEVSKEILNIFQKDVIKMMKEKLLTEGQQTVSIATSEVSKEILNLIENFVTSMKEKTLKILDKILEKNWKSLCVAPVSAKANSILNKKSFYAVRTNYSNSARWTIHRGGVLKRRHKKDHLPHSKINKRAQELQEFKNGPMKAINHLL